MFDHLHETLTDSELIHDGRVVHLYRETVTLPDGRPVIRDVIHHGGAVAIIPIDADGHILMVRQYRIAARRVLLEIPAGGLEPGEDPADCALRECQEETGYKPGQLEKIGGVFLAPGYSTEFIHFFIARDLTASRLDQDDDEFLEVERVSLSATLNMIKSGEICDAKTVSALLMLKSFY